MSPHQFVFMPKLLIIVRIGVMASELIGIAGICGMYTSGGVRFEARHDACPGVVGSPGALDVSSKDERSTACGLRAGPSGYHAACLSADGTKMFVSGGQLQEEANPLDDLYCYDIATGEWDGPRKFICRFDHSIIFYDDKIWAFGGLTNEMAHATEILYFDLGRVWRIMSMSLMA